MTQIAPDKLTVLLALVLMIGAFIGYWFRCFMLALERYTKARYENQHSASLLPPPRRKGRLKPNTMCPPPPPSVAEKQLLRYECEKCGTMQHTYVRQEGIKCIVCGDSMKEVRWFNPDGTTAKPPIRPMT